MPIPTLPGPCPIPLGTIIGTGYNIVNVPNLPGANYKSTTEQLLYEIWQTLLLILAGQNPPGMVVPIMFTIGDGQAGTPANGTTQLIAPTIQGQNILNKSLLVIRNGIALNYSTPETAAQIERYNDGVTNGGFIFDPASGLSFQTGETYQIFVIGINTQIQTP
jgi:hypothetical protein